ncbi:hypothetical protein [Neoaquamicrobium sediminum]|uniref:Uncharacterized protein n=2 Tax=root TaxID=1 RepID=A0AB38ZLJ5_9VIRU
MNRRLKAVLVLAAIVGFAYVLADKEETEIIAAADSGETYRLVHAIGNDETVVAKDLTHGECQIRKQDNIAIAEALGIHSERLGIGSITCLPESLFDD